MKNREENNDYYYHDTILLYLSGLLSEEENKQLYELVKVDHHLQILVEDLEKILISLSESCGDGVKNMRNMKSKILNNISK